VTREVTAAPPKRTAAPLKRKAAPLERKVALQKVKLVSRESIGLPNDQ
jgi:hypothetical protein